MTRILVVDSYDSFVYNIVQYLGEIGVDPVVVRNDAVDTAGITEMAPDGILLSPGPGRPEDAGIICDVVSTFAGSIPVFGVCLGHQAIGHVYGAKVVRAPMLMHGKTSAIHHDGSGVFADLPTPLEATRYHSLVVDAATVPPELIVTARTDDGLVMGLRHTSLEVEGVQFHPESILTVSGREMLRTFATRCGMPTSR